MVAFFIVSPFLSGGSPLFSYSRTSLFWGLLAGLLNSVACWALLAAMRHGGKAHRGSVYLALSTDSYSSRSFRSQRVHHTASGRWSHLCTGRGDPACIVGSTPDFGSPSSRSGKWLETESDSEKFVAAPMSSRSKKL
jgi:hypothetical protein